MKPRFNLFSQPSQIIQLLRYGDLRVLADHDAREIGDVCAQGVNVPVSFDKNLDVEFHQPFEAQEPFPAVHVGIGGCKVTPHESIARQQNLLLGIIENNVVVAVAGGRDYLQTSRVASHRFTQQLERVRQVRRLSDYRSAYPREFFEWHQESGGHLGNVDGSTSKVGQPVEVADVFLVSMGSDDFYDFRF